jgi:hypothetical protein
MLTFATDKGGIMLVPVWPNNGAPTSGTSGTHAGLANTGDLLSDTSSGTLYIQTGTKASPIWTAAPAGTTVAITGGTIDGTVVGGTTPAAGTFTTLAATSFDSTPIGSNTPSTGAFTTLSATSATTLAAVTTTALHVDTGTKTASATAGAATLNKMAGVITSESLTTTAGSDYTLTLTNSDIAAADQVFASVQLGTSTTGEPAVTSVTPSAGQVVILVRNIAASAVFNGTIKISFLVVKN